ncbi:YwdI family protein [Bacillus sp. DNRA2]|uniref:DUF5327 family protein n=1 Tax=Bacillus sp. DNRA2 TaxID=2723053 RepID=UPI00145F2CDF|nr:YwdI family protein [Bacillus sp. DNRA2]
MNIPLHKLLQKMEEEIRKAQTTSSEANIRERVQAIKTLCELVLDEAGSDVQVKAIPALGVGVSSSMFQAQSQPVRQPPGRKLDEDEANGDSLFDF